MIEPVDQGHSFPGRQLRRNGQKRAVTQLEEFVVRDRKMRNVITGISEDRDKLACN